MTRRRTALALVLAALAFGAAPAEAALPVVKDSFTITGRAGDRVRIRIAGPFTMTADFGKPPVTSVRASGGPFGGFALVGHGQEHLWYAVATTPEWSCGAASCRGTSRLLDYQAPTLGRFIAPGEYLLVLLGAPGTTVRATVAPHGKAHRAVRLRPAASAVPVVEPTTDVGTATGAETTEAGVFAVDPRRTGVVGVVHALEMHSGVQSDSYTIAGSVGPDGGCQGTLTPHYAGSGDVIGTLYETQSAASAVGAGQGPLCAAWHGQIKAVVSRQRGLGFFVPIVAG